MKKAFTLIELLVVIAVIALLMSILMPALAAAKAQTRQVVCKSNIRQLVLANLGYACENDGSFVPAASDIFRDNLHRWHGVRDSLDDPFDPIRGPLVAYLGNGKIKECPEKVRFIKDLSWSKSFEKGCGGYGYNMTYIGSRLWQDFTEENCSVTTKDVEVARPAETLMFADTAMAKLDSGNPYYLEYSFAEPRYFVVNGQPDTTDSLTGKPPSPSIHFRHRDKANIGWADGHISSEQMAEFDGINVYGVKSADMMLGWFRPLDNSKFDLK